MIDYGICKRYDPDEARKGTRSYSEISQRRGTVMPHTGVGVGAGGGSGMSPDIVPGGVGASSKKKEKSFVGTFIYASIAQLRLEGKHITPSLISFII